MASEQHSSNRFPVQDGDPATNYGPVGHADATETRERVVPATGAEGTEILDLLGDEYTSRILEALSVEPRPARELVSVCDMSRPTVYRRLDRLEDHDLVSTDTSIDADGQHRKVFATTFERVTIELVGDAPTVHLVVRDSSEERKTPSVPVSAD
ncbi:MAG: putative transcriptional regulator [Natronomonas sp.]|jgi:predicted transcriptional regulator